MGRYIDAERLKQFLKPREWGTPDERWVPEHEIGAMLDYFPAADVEPRWIPVTERLPKESGEYLVSIGYMLCFSWFYKDDGVWSFINADITAWMPLPSPYKGGEEE